MKGPTWGKGFHSPSIVLARISIGTTHLNYGERMLLQMDSERNAGLTTLFVVWSCKEWQSLTRVPLSAIHVASLPLKLDEGQNDTLISTASSTKQIILIASDFRHIN